MKRCHWRTKIWRMPSRWLTGPTPKLLLPPLSEEADDEAPVLAKQVWEAVGRIEGSLHSLAQDFAILQGRVGAQADSDAGALTVWEKLTFTDERLTLAFKSQL
jgi:hypothetical protein